MRRSVLKCLLAACLCGGFSVHAADDAGATYGDGKNSFALATGSPGELGLLKVLAEDTDASAGDKATVAYFGGVFNGAALILGTGHTLSTVSDALRAVGIHSPSPRR